MDAKKKQAFGLYLLVQAIHRLLNFEILFEKDAE